MTITATIFKNYHSILREPHTLDHRSEVRGRNGNE